MASLLLYGAMTLLLVDSVIELGFIVTTVGWLHGTAGRYGFLINYQGDQFLLAGKPLNLLGDQGHTANGAAGTNIVVICVGGALALFLRHRQLKRRGGISGFSAFLYNFWLWMTAITAVFTVAAFVYVFVETYRHTGQSIDVQFASQLGNTAKPPHVPYPRDAWTPQNWYPAVLDLDLATSGDRSDIVTHLKIMKGWQWNLIPMMILNIVVAALAFMDRMRHKQDVNRSNGNQTAYEFTNYAKVPSGSKIHLTGPAS
ncbi:uncharacterized protein LTR77_008305 [Saxophila tyrrhenica]|uniref:Uncharacterized protein n=1 Tax=Saxophila tyrrhenica TaxID=1690608 RepID=A0AAV9P0I8_9PEZI|nr:hypothetical protein LTR77_008305 [Saxophila tyrrhenica]